MSDDQNALPSSRGRRKKPLKAIQERRQNWAKVEREARAAISDAPAVSCLADDEPQSELQPLPDLGGAWWTIPEACIWIATRDGRYLAEANERVRRSLFVADEALSEAARRLEPPSWLTVSEARKPLVAAFGGGETAVTGRLRGQGSQVTIEPLAWANLEVTEDSRHGMIARAPGFDPSADWWDTLRVSAGAIRAKWPFDQHPATLLPGYDVDGLPDRGEMPLSEAWAWCLWKEAARENNGPSRVAWKDLGDRIELKLFDAFALGDLDCIARLDPTQQVWSPVPADWFRLKVELLPGQNKLQAHTKADMADFGPAWQIVRLATDFRVKVEPLRRWSETIKAKAKPPDATASDTIVATEPPPVAPGGTRAPDADPASSPSATDKDVRVYLMAEQARLLEAGEQCGKNEVRVYLRHEFPHLSRDGADRFYDALDDELRPKTGPKGPWKKKPKSS